MTGEVRILVYTRTTAYRHESIAAGVATLRELGDEAGFAVDAGEDVALFRDDRLSRYTAVVFLSTSGRVLDDAGRAALERFVTGGGGFVGVHAAATSEPDWPFFATLLGARFAGHPAVQPATIQIEDRSHPATAHLPAGWAHTDEWYDFDIDPRPDVRVLARVDESTYTGGTMGADHPIAWCHRNAGGPSFYTALGHPVEAYAEPALRQHLLGGIRYAASPASVA